MKIPQSKLISFEIDPSDPLYLPPTDSPDDVLVSMKLTGPDNYLQWNQAMSISLHAKNKFGFIDGTIPMPSKDDGDFPFWKQANEMVLSWLLNTIHSDLIPTNMAFQSAAVELWNDLLDRFSPDDNIQIFNLKRAIATQKQGNDSLLVYFNKLRKFWYDLSFFLPISSCSCENNQVQEVMQFLLGLDESYAWFRRRILSNYPLPQIDEVYAWILEVERVNASPEMSDEEIDKEDLVRSEPDEGRNPENEAIKDHWRCAHCNQSNHTIDLCYQLHGYPPNYHEQSVARNHSNSSSWAEGYGIELKHFTHEHPLVFSLESKKDVAYCSGCGLVLVGPTYSCEDCNFILHKFCTEIPGKTMHYHGHPQHPLSFLITSIYPGGRFRCDECEITGQGFHFHCSLCSYDLHLHCALMPIIFAHESHPHPLNLEKSRGSPHCHACSAVCSRMSYSCSKCEYFLHPSCASLPRYISVIADLPFTLCLTYSTGSSEMRCYLCDRVPDDENWFYYCKDFRVFVHLDCGAKQALCPPLSFNDLNKNGLGFQDYVERYIKGVHMQTIRLRESSRIAGRIMGQKAESGELDQDPKHQHALILIDESVRSKNLCSWCHQLLSGTIYGCYQCKFFMHKMCCEAPRKITHHFHPQHPLILLPRVPRRRRWCTACDILISGTVFCCKPCGIFLHPECALLPQEARYDRHFHRTFNLVYEIEDDGSDEYYCHVCEQRLYEKWAYKCANCDYTSHMACMIPSALPSRKNDAKGEKQRHRSKLVSEPKKF